MKISRSPAEDIGARKIYAFLINIKLIICLEVAKRSRSPESLGV